MSNRGETADSIIRYYELSSISALATTDLHKNPDSFLTVTTVRARFNAHFGYKYFSAKGL
jgi:hypothetical protein